MHPPSPAGFRIQPPSPISDADWAALVEHGGFPEPFFKRDAKFSRRWRALRQDQLTKEDLREVAILQHPGVMETLAHILAETSSQQLVYSNLSREIGVAVDTVKRWIDLLVRLHYGFMVRPWFKNVAKSLRKEPKWFLRDWSGIEDAGARAETLVACHLLKAVEGWTELGLGTFELRYLRDKLKREVDFLIVGGRRPAPRHDESCSTSYLRIYYAHYFRGARVPAKKAVNVSVPAELLDAARAEDINLSAVLETALAEQLRIRRREKWLAESARAIAAYNREIDEHGAFGDKVRSF